MSDRREEGYDDPGYEGAYDDHQCEWVGYSTDEDGKSSSEYCTDEGSIWVEEEGGWYCQSHIPMPILRKQ